MNEPQPYQPFQQFQGPDLTKIPMAEIRKAIDTLAAESEAATRTCDWPRLQALDTQLAGWKQVFNWRKERERDEKTKSRDE